MGVREKKKSSFDRRCVYFYTEHSVSRDHGLKKQEIIKYYSLSGGGGGVVLLSRLVRLDLTR